MKSALFIKSMFPYFHLFGLHIPSYGMLIGLGIIASALYLHKQEKRGAVFFDDVLLSVLYGLIGALIGSKLLYLVTLIPQASCDAAGSSLWNLIKRGCMNGGFVYYGGLYGFLFFSRICSRKQHIVYRTLADTFVPVIPLFHIFGRIGCFLTGCCYGIRTTSHFGVSFSVSEIAPNGIPLIPVQLMESFGECIIFIYLNAVSLHQNKSDLTGLYLLMYGSLRFCLEFLRGDCYRGFLGMFSVSQWLSLFSITLGLFLLHLNRKSDVVQ